MAEEIQERVYNVPLRREYIKVSRYRRTKRAVTALRQFLVRHMKSEDVKIGTQLNEALWKHGMKNPPHHIKIHTAKKEKVVYAELFGVPIQFEKKKVEKKGLAEKLGLGGKEEEKLEEKVDIKKEAKAEKKEEPKVEKKTETKVEHKEAKEPAHKPAVKEAHAKLKEAVHKK